MSTIKIISVILFSILIQNGKTFKHYMKFPYGFLIGSASSAFQVEGAWNISGKQESILDHFVHNHPEKIADNSNANTAADEYHKYKEDVKLMQDIGFDTYRFSISWPRILPSGYADHVNQEGVNYYHRLLDELEKRGITPIVTIYHWDHPKSLEKIGGWLNERMAYLYSDYARTVFRTFGHRVKMFTTINEPRNYCMLKYKLDYFPTNGGLNLSYLNEYHCVHNMLKAHALAYRTYDREFRAEQRGKIGLAVLCNTWYNKNEEDLASSEIAFEFTCGHALNPILAGDYSEVVKRRVAARSSLQGYEKSRLPAFSREWAAFVKGTADYVGVNHYTSAYVERLPYSEILKWPNDEGMKYSVDPYWPSSPTRWLKVVPKGLGDLLRKLKNKYNNPQVYVLENGVSDNDDIEDNLRSYYLYSYMKEMLIAVKQDDCNVRGYIVRSFLDSFEYTSGYSSKFGVVHVNFTDGSRKRTLKKSALWLKVVLKSRKLVCYDYMYC